MPRPAFDWPAAAGHFETYLRARPAAPKTLVEYSREVAYLGRWLEERGRPPRPATVTIDDLRTYVGELLTGEGSRTRKPIAAFTVAKTVAALRTFFTVLFLDGELAQNPAARLSPPKLPRRPVFEGLTPGEVGRLLAATNTLTPAGLRDRATVEVFYGTGIRRGELIALDLDDIDHAERQLLIRHGKGGHARNVPLPPSAYRALQAYVRRGRPWLRSVHPDSLRAVFLTRGGRRLHPPCLFHTLRRLARAANIAKQVGPHCLRRTIATQLLVRGASLRHIQLFLGHANLKTTALYLCIGPRELGREILRRHPREHLRSKRDDRPRRV